MPDLKVLLISTYELGRQPFGLASPAGWLRADGFQTTSLDLSRQSLDEEAVRTARLIALRKEVIAPVWSPRAIWTLPRLLCIGPFPGSSSFIRLAWSMRNPARLLRQPKYVRSYRVACRPPLPSRLGRQNVGVSQL